jgi:hypothetical protein
MDKGKAAALLIGLAPKKGSGASPEPSDEEAGEEMDVDGLEVAASDAFDAIARKSRSDFVSAFKSAVQIAMASED